MNAELAAALQAAAAQPWALMPERAATVSALITDLSLGRDVAESRLSAAFASRSADGLFGARGAPERIHRAGNKDTAVVRISGLLLYSLDFPPFVTSARRVALDIQQLAADQSVGTIILDIDSPGGVTTGIEEAADAVFAARSKKAVIAVANPLAASAAYWIGSQASSFAVVPSGVVGSIGTFALHMDLSRAMDAAGITPTFIKAGERKTDGNPFEPLSDRARSDVQNDVDTLYRGFVNAVARGRRASAATVRKDFGEGNLVMAREAVRLGMADRIATIEQVIAGGVSAPPSAAGIKGGSRKAGIAARSSNDKSVEARRRRLRIAMLEVGITPPRGFGERSGQKQ